MAKNKKQVVLTQPTVVKTAASNNPNPAQATPTPPPTKNKKPKEDLTKKLLYNLPKDNQGLKEIERRRAERAEDIKQSADKAKVKANEVLSKDLEGLMSDRKIKPTIGAVVSRRASAGLTNIGKGVLSKLANNLENNTNHFKAKTTSSTIGTIKQALGKALRKSKFTFSDEQLVDLGSLFLSFSTECPFGSSNVIDNPEDSEKASKNKIVNATGNQNKLAEDLNLKANQKLINLNDIEQWIKSGDK